MKLFIRKLSGVGLILALSYFGIQACDNGNTPTSYTLNLNITGAGLGSVSSNTGGISCNSTGGTCSGTLNEGTVVTLSATPDSGYIFKGWSGAGCSGTDSCQVTMNAATTVNAVFTMILFTSDLNLNGNSSDTPNDSYNVWVMKTDGSGLRAVTTVNSPGADAQGPEWSPNGEQIVFNAYFDLTNPVSGSSTSNIWTINSDGSSLTALTHGSNTNESKSPQWSPNGNQIVFQAYLDLTDPTSASSNTCQNIWVMNSDGTGLSHLTASTNGGQGALDPVWSPNGSQIAFSADFSLTDPNSSTLANSFNLWVVNSNGTGLDALTEIDLLGSDAESVQWSPDGTQLTFSASFDLSTPTAGPSNSSNNIWVMNADGSDLSPLTSSDNTAASSHNPQWSPNGDVIAFASSLSLTDPAAGGPNTSSSDNIWQVGENGSLTPLTNTDIVNTSASDPQWSPNGSQIVFLSYFNLTDPVNGSANGASNVWLMDSNGDDLAALTNFSLQEAQNATF